MNLDPVSAVFGAAFTAIIALLAILAFLFLWEVAKRRWAIIAEFLKFVYRVLVDNTLLWTGSVILVAVLPVLLLLVVLTPIEEWSKLALLGVIVYFFFALTGMTSLFVFWAWFSEGRARRRRVLGVVLSSTFKHDLGELVAGLQSCQASGQVPQFQVRHFLNQCQNLIELAGARKATEAIQAALNAEMQRNQWLRVRLEVEVDNAFSPRLLTLHLYILDDQGHPKQHIPFERDLIW